MPADGQQALVGPDQYSGVDGLAGGGPIELVAAPGSQVRVVVFALWAQNTGTGAQTVTFRQNDGGGGTDDLWQFDLPADQYSAMVMDWTTGLYLSTDEALEVTSTVAGGTRAWVWYALSETRWT